MENGDVESVETRSIASTANHHTPNHTRTLKTPLGRKPKLTLKSSVAEQIHELESIEKSLLFRQLRPLFFCMRIFGIYFNHKSKESDRRGLTFVRNWSLQQRYCLLVVVISTFLCNWSLQQQYCLLVIVILLVYLAWSLVAFRVCFSVLSVYSYL